MRIYDDKTNGVIASGKQLLLSSIKVSEDVTFKASFIILSELRCNGRITALFDLIVLGDVEAKEIEIKGRFVCLGNCKVNGSMIVQNDIWAEDIQATSITCHDRIVAQSIDADTVNSDMNIIIGKTFAIAEKAVTNQNIICGETAFGTGRICASKIITSDPLDLDEGTEALESPFTYSPSQETNHNSELDREAARYSQNNDFRSFFDKLFLIPEIDTTNQFPRYLSVLNTIATDYPSSIDGITDISILLSMVKIINTDYFKDWPIIRQWTEEVKKHFENMIEGKSSDLTPKKSALKMLKGYTVSHDKYGLGLVEDVIETNATRIAYINFSEYGVKTFPLPDSLKFFSVLSETPISSNEEPRISITCEINSFVEWLSSLTLIEENKDYLGENLYRFIFDLLVDKIGLKAKFVEDRFKEKGWTND